MSKRNVIAWDEPVFDGEWCINYGMMTYWSPSNIIESSPFFDKEPFYEETFELTYQNHCKMF